MPNTTPTIRVVVRLPYNRPEEPIPDPPRVEWNSEKEQILWEVIAKSRAVEGAGTDWKGLAAHLEVPLPYLLYRAQTRYEEDLRGLQGIRETLSPVVTSPASQFPSNGFNILSKGNPILGEYFPRLPSTADRPHMARRDSMRSGNGNVPSTVIGRPLGVRARLNSLGNTAIRSRTFSNISQPKKVSSSSTLTLQGPKRTRSTIRPPLTPTPSNDSESASSNDASSDEEHNKQEAEEKKAEEQQALDRKLEELQRMMTRETLGLVSSPPPPPRLSTSRTQGRDSIHDRGRNRPLSASSTSSSFRQQQQLTMSRRHSISQTPSHHSLSSTSSPQGSIPSIPSPPPEARQLHQQSPMARHLSPAGSTSPPIVSRGAAWGQPVRQGTSARPYGGRASERGSEMGSEASSFSDLSDASLSASALESALMSNIRGGGSRISNFARNQLSGRRSNTIR
ncbi:hypothetical protein C8Q75DRAFT_743561 [Abortiporus biennis]|nr:hypothetical protein C8Q75DRAFT_743561 [Abortiporus biennis]